MLECKHWDAIFDNKSESSKGTMKFTGIFLETLFLRERQINMSDIYEASGQLLQGDGQQLFGPENKGEREIFHYVHSTSAWRTTFKDLELGMVQRHQ